METPENYLEIVNKEIKKEIIEGKITEAEIDERRNILLRTPKYQNLIAQLHPVEDTPHTELDNGNIEDTSYVENEKGEKFEKSLSPSRKQDANFIDGNKFSYYETFELTKYDITNKLKVQIKFRGKFLYYLKQEKLDFYGKNKHLRIVENFEELKAKIYNKEWIAYCKEPFENVSRVIKYLGRYTHRVAISNNRILKEEKGKVTFKYKDRKDNNKEKEMTLEAEEFIRRFLLHILPPGFIKIRHYGLLGNRNKKTKLAICKKLTNTANTEKIELSALEILKKTLGVDFNLCPFCKKGHLVNPNSA